jgi:hypothetical protein
MPIVRRTRLYKTEIVSCCVGMILWIVIVGGFVCVYMSMVRGLVGNGRVLAAWSRHGWISLTGRGGDGIISWRWA